MTLNGDKTILVLFRRQENTNQKKTPYLDTFQAVECAKYLEILVENLLSWGSHIRHLNLKSTRGVGILTKLGKFVSKDILKSLYFTFVQSHIDYDLILCGTAMNSTTKKKKKKLENEERCEKQFFKSYNADSEPLFKELNILSFYKQKTFDIIQFMGNCITATYQKIQVAYFN